MGTKRMHHLSGKYYEHQAEKWFLLFDNAVLSACGVEPTLWSKVGEEGRMARVGI
jgi:hypothetical protein